MTWYKGFVSQLEEMADLEFNWNGYGSKPPSGNAYRNIRKVMDILIEIEVEPSGVAPSADDGITISFFHGDDYGAIEAYNDGQVWCILHLKNQEPDTWPLNNHQYRPQLIGIKRFCRRLGFEPGMVLDHLGRRP